MNEMEHQEGDGALNLGQMFKDTDKFVKGLGLPTMTRPTSLGEQYSFPADVGALRSDQLGLLSMQLTAYYTYALGILGREESALGAFQEIYDIKLGLAMDEQDSRREGRTVKEVLKALAIQNDDELMKLHRVLISRRHRVKQLEVQVNIYHEQLVRLSREQSRREAEARAIH